jgi:hypothetical protein
VFDFVTFDGCDVLAHNNVLKGQVSRVETPIIEHVFIIKHFSIFNQI